MPNAYNLTKRAKSSLDFRMTNLGNKSFSEGRK
jgi:hypothetical protein